MHSLFTCAIVWTPHLINLRMVLYILHSGLPSYINLRWNVFSRVWFWEVFLFFIGTSFLFFSFSFPLFHGDSFQYSHILLVFILSEHFDAFLIFQISSFRCFSFTPFPNQLKKHFSNPNSLPKLYLHIRIVCSMVSTFYYFYFQVHW